MKNVNASSKSLSNKQHKDKQIYIDYIKRSIEKGTGLSFIELKKTYNEEELFYVGLYHVTTTKKAFCEAMKIPVEAGCRYKRRLEKEGKLMESLEEIICPFTKHPAHQISTNPLQFDYLKKSNQTKLF